MAIYKHIKQKNLIQLNTVLPDFVERERERESTSTSSVDSLLQAQYKRVYEFQPNKNNKHIFVIGKNKFDRQLPDAN